MMDWNQQLKLQGYLDGELSDAERQQVETLLQNDKEAVALFAELQQTSQAVANFGADLRLPESREFFWSKIRRDIEHLEKETAAAPASVSWLQVLRRTLVPISGVAVVLLAGLLLTRQATSQGSETYLDDSGAFTYHDFDHGATLVWLTYPAENELAADDEAA